MFSPWVGWVKSLEPQQLSLFLLVPLLLLLLVKQFMPGTHDHLPYINRPANFDFFALKSKRHFVSNTRSLMANARQAFKGKPYRMFTDLGALIVLPSEHIDGIRNEPALSFLQFFVDNFHPNITGFEGFAFDGRKDELLQRTINKKLNRLLSLWHHSS